MGTEAFTPRFHSSRTILAKYEEAHVYKSTRELADTNIVTGIGFLADGEHEGTFIVRDYADYVQQVIDDVEGINYIRSTTRPEFVWVRNSADFQVVIDRANHVGVQPMNTVIGLTAALQALSNAIEDPGQIGLSGLVAFLTNETHTLAADEYGNVINYTGANGRLYIFWGLSDVTNLFNITVTGNPQALA